MGSQGVVHRVDHEVGRLLASLVSPDAVGNDERQYLSTAYMFDHPEEEGRSYDIPPRVAAAGRERHQKMLDITGQGTGALVSVQPLVARWGRLKRVNVTKDLLERLSADYQPLYFPQRLRTIKPTIIMLTRMAHMAVVNPACNSP